MKGMIRVGARLIYLKIRDDDGYYRIWTLDSWQIWRETNLSTFDIKKVIDQKLLSSGISIGNQGELVNQGKNSLGEIPWIWVYNMKTDFRGLGQSDISDIARIDVSIMRNLSEIEEVITFGAFPMMRKPYKSQGMSSLDKDEVGMTAILEFDPENPNSKPDWLPASVVEPVSAILSLIEKKIAEIYRSSNVGGMASMEIQSDARSGTALKAEFQLLNAKLVSKGLVLEKVEREIVRLWLKWFNNEVYMDQITIERSDTYEVENLAQNLDNIITSKYVVTSSPTFNKTVEKKVVRLLLSGETNETLAQIDYEIDNYIKPSLYGEEYLDEENEDFKEEEEGKEEEEEEGI